MGELVDLDGQQRGGDDEGQVLGPAALVPQADRLDALDRRVDEDHRGEEVKARGLQREELVDLAQQPVLAVAAAGHGAALQVGDDAVEALAEGGAMRGEEQDRDAEQPEDEEVQGAVDRDQAQDDLVAQRASAQRQLDLVAAGRVLARGRRRRRGGPASCRSAGSGTSARRPISRTTSASSLAHLRGIEADELVARHAADQQLPMQARDEACGARADSGRRSGGVGHAPKVPARRRRAPRPRRAARSKASAISSYERRRASWSWVMLTTMTSSAP